MKIHEVEQKSEKWHLLRKGKITGSELKSIVGGDVARKSFLYEMIARRLSSFDIEDESSIEWGIRLEEEALQEFELQTGKKVDRIGFCENEDNEFICSSPDGLIKNKGKYTEAVEIKCPAKSGNHIKTWLENKIPKEYIPQVVQYFIVNDDLKILYFVSYDPRITVMPYWCIEATREELESYIEGYKKEQEAFIDDVEEVLKRILPF